MMIKGKKWFLLALCVIFDNVFSYFAIQYMGKQEGHPISRFFVEISPLFYFVFIPVTLFGFWVLGKVVSWLAVKTPEGVDPEKREIYERIVLTTILIAWGIGNTLWNFLYLLRGYFPLGIHWRTLELIGIVLALTYAFYMDLKVRQFYGKKS